MILDAEVRLWNTRIGLVHQDAASGVIFFEYDRDFLKSGIQPAPLMMPLDERVYSFPELRGDAFLGLPGLLADSLPDRFGRSVLNGWLIKQGRSPDSLGVVERLCYTGTRGMGALEFSPAMDSPWDVPDEIDINEMTAMASEILSERSGKKADARDIALSGLLEFGTSAGGARAKAVIAWNEKTGEIRSGQIDTENGFEYWLVKFDGVKGNGDHNLADNSEYTSVEYAYYLMARDCGILMNECRLWDIDGLRHFMTKRFDRRGADKIHMQTFAGLTHTDYNYPGLKGYEDAGICIRRLGGGISQIEQLFRRMYFNHRTFNLDDHVKNISFLMDRRGIWTLAPAYDMTFAFDPGNRWLKMHQMTINGKRIGISMNDIYEAGKNMGLPLRKCKEITAQIDSIAADWRKYASSCDISSSLQKSIDDVINNGNHTSHLT